MRTIQKVLVGQSGGPTVAINSSLAGIINQAHKHDIEVIGMCNGIEGFFGRSYRKPERYIPSNT